MRLLNVIKYNVLKIALFVGILLTAACNVEDISKIFQTYSISGSVGDGPVTGAQIIAIDTAGGIAGASLSDSRAEHDFSNIETSRYFRFDTALMPRHISQAMLAAYGSSHPTVGGSSLTKPIHV